MALQRRTLLLTPLALGCSSLPLAAHAAAPDGKALLAKMDRNFDPEN